MKYILSFYLLSISFLFSTFQLNAQQSLGFGFKTGLNFSQLNGDFEEFESHNSNVGFHIGAGINYNFVDNFGARLEFSFEQKGTKYKYLGTSDFKINDLRERAWTFKDGELDLAVNITNTYISFPISLFAKYKKFEISGGVGVSFLTSTKGTGDFIYEGSGSSDFNSNVNLTSDQIFQIEADYKKDDAGETDIALSAHSLITGQEAVSFARIQNAYWDFDADNEVKKFNSTDFFIHGGLSYFFNKGLFIGGKVIYSLADVTNNNSDKLQGTLTDTGELMFSDAKHGYLTTQIAIGFNF